jgi:hypothetical protein
VPQAGGADAAALAEKKLYHGTNFAVVTKSLHRRLITQPKGASTIRFIPDHKAIMTGLGRVLNNELVCHCYSMQPFP